MNANGEKEIDVVGLPNDDVFKRPADNADGNATKKIKLEEEGRATREITSVMMTTSGFISPAREGKLPESRAPKLPDEFPKTVATPPMISPPFKAKDSLSSPVPSLIDKKLEKKLKKKNHEKEKKKDKQHKDKFSLPDPAELAQYDPSPPSSLSSHALPPQIQMMPREANEQMIMAERKKELKKLKMQKKDDVKKKKEKIPKGLKNQSFEAAFLDRKSSPFDPFQVLPNSLPQPPPASSQIQAHNYLTGAAHTLFTNSMLDQAFGSSLSPLLSAQNPLIEGKLVSEPDKQKLNIFKKISKPKDDAMKQQQQQQQLDFLTPSKLDKFEANQQSSGTQASTSGSGELKKVHKLPKETTLTRVDDSNIPMNLSGVPRSNESSFEEMASMPKTPTIARTPDFKMTQSVEKKEKKERKKKEKKNDQPDWTQQHQQQQQQQYPNPFDLVTAQSNPFLQSLQSGGLMGNLGNFMSNRNPFSLPTADIFSSGPGLIPKPFGLNQSPMNQMINPYGFPLGGMEMNLLQQQQEQQQQQQPSPKPKKVKPAKPAKPPKSSMDDFLHLGSKFCNVAPLVPQSIIRDRFDAKSFMNVDTFPLQQQSTTPINTFDQLLKDQAHTSQQELTSTKKFTEEKMETFDLTKDSSPEPVMTVPMPSTSSSTTNSAVRQETALPPQQTPSSFQQEYLQDQQQLTPIVKEKSKEKKKKKDKDKDKERDKEKDKDKEERKKVNFKFSCQC